MTLADHLFRLAMKGDMEKTSVQQKKTDVRVSIQRWIKTERNVEVEDVPSGVCSLLESSRSVCNFRNPASSFPRAAIWLNWSPRARRSRSFRIPSADFNWFSKFWVSCGFWTPWGFWKSFWRRAGRICTYFHPGRSSGCRVMTKKEQCSTTEQIRTINIWE